MSIAYSPSSASPDDVANDTANMLVPNIVLQADLFGSPVIRPADIEATALGAASAAGLAIAVWKEDDVFFFGEKHKKATIFRPTLNEELRKKKAESWSGAVQRTFNLADLSLFK
ncbi:Glycerol kinase [Melia azedarach]|uniref:Glycerol kinase n=1 Tax=Melia azedarach TaxID=155640 RepID=A0ACC1Y551_MELAZ|nr:Glycerol kinase [Melia azedarach]